MSLEMHIHQWDHHHRLCHKHIPSPPLPSPPLSLPSPCGEAAILNRIIYGGVVEKVALEQGMKEGMELVRSYRWKEWSMQKEQPG